MVWCVRKSYSKCLFFDRYRNISINVCSIILIVVLILFLLFSLFFKINFCTSYSGYVVKEDDFYVRLFLNDNDIHFLQEDELVFNGKRVDYNIVSISDEYVLSNGLVRAVLLSFDLDNKEKIVNNVINLHFLRKNTIFNKVKEMFL